MSSLSAGLALWNHRHLLSGIAPVLYRLREAVGRPEDMPPQHWAQLFAFTLEYQPDLILELGRGHGNSTCCFLEAARHLQRYGSGCRLVSLCRDSHWEEQTLPRLRPLCEADWFARGRFIQYDITRYDFREVLEEASRVLVYWDAPGFEVAGHLLCELMPKLVDRSHVVVLPHPRDADLDDSPGAGGGETGAIRTS